MTAGHIHCLGPLVLDRVLTVERLPGHDEKAFIRGRRDAAGGPPRNVAAALARWGDAVSLVSVVGDDQTGADLLRDLGDQGIGSEAIDVIPDLATATTIIIVDATGEKAILIEPIPPPVLARIGSGLTPARGDAVIANLYHPGAVHAVFARARAAGALTVLDLELPEIERWGWAAAEAAAAAADLVTTNAQVLRAWPGAAGPAGLAAALGGNRGGPVAPRRPAGRHRRHHRGGRRVPGRAGQGDPRRPALRRRPWPGHRCRRPVPGRRPPGRGHLEERRVGLGRGRGPRPDPARGTGDRPMITPPPRIERIRRVLAAACCGDALGAATEAMPPEAILSVFGGRVETLRPPPPLAPFARGLEPGRLTDDASQMLAMVRMLAARNGQPGPADAVAALLAWAEDADMVARFAGPTTRLALERLRAGVPPERVATPETYSCSFGASNGAAMRAPAAGCARPGDPAAAAALACLLAAPTHNTQIAFAGAAAVAAAIAAGLDQPGWDAAALHAAAQRGAEAGEGLALRLGRIVGGASIRHRLDLAVAIGAGHPGDPDRAMAALTQVVGNGVAMAEAVPCAFGLVIAAAGDPWAAILAAVNGGNDSDTIAMIAGAVAQAWSAADAAPPGIVAEIERVNRLDLHREALALARTLPETRR
jgi:ADP-ribosylglycohydrolase